MGPLSRCERLSAKLTSSAAWIAESLSAAGAPDKVELAPRRCRARVAPRSEPPAQIAAALSLAASRFPCDRRFHRRRAPPLARERAARLPPRTKGAPSPSFAWSSPPFVALSPAESSAHNGQRQRFPRRRVPRTEITASGRLLEHDPPRKWRVPRHADRGRLQSVERRLQALIDDAAAELPIGRSRPLGPVLGAGGQAEKLDRFLGAQIERRENGEIGSHGRPAWVRCGRWGAADDEGHGGEAGPAR